MDESQTWGQTAGPEQASTKGDRRDGQDDDVSEESNEPRFMTLRQVADLPKCSQGQVYSLVRSGDLQGIQIGGRNQWRVERPNLRSTSSRPTAVQRRTWNGSRPTTQANEDPDKDDETGWALCVNPRPEVWFDSNICAIMW